MEQNTYIQEEEISFKEIVGKIQEYIKELFRKWYIVLLISLPFIGWFYYKYTLQNTTYTAETKFIIEGQIGGGVSGLLSQFGFRGAGGNSKTNPFKVQEVAKSKLTIRNILFKKYNGDFLANHLLREYSITDKWSKKSPDFKEFSFTSDDYQNFDSLQNKVLLALIKKVIGVNTFDTPLLNFKYDEDSGVFNYQFTSKNEDLTLQLNDELYQYLVNFFDTDALQSQGNTNKILREKADSLKNLIDRKIYQISKISDQSQGLILQTPNARKLVLEGELVALKTAYAEIIKSYEISDAGIRDAKTMFVKLDEPIPPLEPDEPSIFLSLIKGILLGFLVGSLIVIFRKIFRDAMA